MVFVENWKCFLLLFAKGFQSEESIAHRRQTSAVLLLQIELEWLSETTPTPNWSYSHDRESRDQAIGPDTGKNDIFRWGSSVRKRSCNSHWMWTSQSCTSRSRRNSALVVGDRRESGETKKEKNCRPPTTDRPLHAAPLATSSCGHSKCGMIRKTRNIVQLYS